MSKVTAIAITQCERNLIIDNFNNFLDAEKAYTVEDVMKYQAEISILTFVHKKFYLEDAADATFTLCSFRHIATIDGCMFHLFC